LPGHGGSRRPGRRPVAPSRTAEPHRPEL